MTLPVALPGSPHAPPFALELSAIRKRFGAVEALTGATLRVRRGTVHALLGENGAGKTTLMRVAFGLVVADEGTVSVDGTRAAFRTPAQAMARGIGMVHQHFTLVPAMTVAENVSLGMRGRYDARAAADRVRAIGARTGLALDPWERVADLPVGAQQRVEIVKALARDIGILVLDEPTAVLAPPEADELLQWVRRWVRQGNAAILITHKLREAAAVADDVTVLRRGATVLAAPAAALYEGALVRAMLGAEIAGASAPRQAAVPGAVVLSLRDAVATRARGGVTLRAATLEVRAGEIVGVAAVEGAGQAELLRLLSGRLAPAAGAVSLPSRIAFIPADRHRDALVLDMSLTENVALRGLGSRRGAMPWTAVREATTAILERFDVRAAGPDSRAGALSGGNQQKLVFGREMIDQPTAVVAENPTRGLDIRATSEVHARLRAARHAGCAVVIYSSDLDEVLALADRVVVVHAGRLRAVEATREAAGRAMLGVA